MRTNRNDELAVWPGGVHLELAVADRADPSICQGLQDMAGSPDAMTGKTVEGPDQQDMQSKRTQLLQNTGHVGVVRSLSCGNAADVEFGHDVVATMFSLIKQVAALFLGGLVLCTRSKLECGFLHSWSSVHSHLLSAKTVRLKPSMVFQLPTQG